MTAAGAVWYSKEMRTPRLSLVLLASATALVACTAHDKAGDRAAAVGDWRSAYAEYHQAVQDHPEDAALKAKYDDARARALAGASGHAQACQAQGDWDCVLAESSWVLAVDPSDVRAAELRRAAADRVALSQVAAARDRIARGELPAAVDLVRRASQLSSAPAVVAAVQDATRAWSAAALGQVEQLRAARRYADGLKLLETGMAIDPGLRARHDALKQEQDAWIASEHDRLVGEGEALLAQRRWGDAAARLRDAQALRPDDRARALERYARLALAGDQAVERADFGAATKAYEEAAAVGVDGTGYAVAQLARVRVRPWAIRIDSVVVSPARPDGLPWVGRPSRRVARLASALLDGTALGRIVFDLPPENRPTLVVEVLLPDGRRLRTAPVRGIAASPAASFVVAANAYDARRVGFRVFHEEPGGLVEDIGVAGAGVGELVSRANVRLQGGSLQALELAAEPADGAVPGSFANLRPVGPPPPPGAPPRTVPASVPAPPPGPAAAPRY